MAAMRKRGDVGTGRTKEARKLIKLIEAAGGTVERTGQGHLKVTGPAGVATVGGSVKAGRETMQALRTVERYTGLVLR